MDRLSTHALSSLWSWAITRFGVLALPVEVAEGVFQLDVDTGCWEFRTLQAAMLLHYEGNPALAWPSGKRQDKHPHQKRREWYAVYFRVGMTRLTCTYA